jgi:hypothetical protein
MKSETPLKTESEDAEAGYRGLPILSGILENGKKVQIMLVKPGNGRIVRTVLDFYASPVMTFICGTSSMHFYYKKSNKGEGFEWDFKHDPKQRLKLAQKAVKKWKERNWKFTKSNLCRQRNAGDDRSKIVSFESFYVSALESLGRSTKEIPDSVQKTFRQIKAALATYAWVEEDRRIQTVRDRSVNIMDGRGRFFEDVQRLFQSHAQVLSQTTWDNRDTAKVELDVWFAGVHTKLYQVEDVPEYYIL